MQSRKQYLYEVFAAGLDLGEALKAQYVCFIDHLG